MEENDPPKLEQKADDRLGRGRLLAAKDAARLRFAARFFRCGLLRRPGATGFIASVVVFFFVDPENIGQSCSSP